ncbi:hypothetical protein DFS34DRAFT_688602 [Phlyctochytrium arcticum]|nr:hypothetical protein DFS34DRAFT_688602 [Phlyctochytrium arcticum]
MYCFADEIISVSFGNASLDDVVWTCGVSVNSQTWVLPTAEVHDDDGPSELLVRILDKLLPIWSLNSEATRRTIIDLFLIDVLAREEFNHILRAFGEVPMEYTAAARDGKRRKLNGRVDYMIGHAGLKHIHDYDPPKDSHLVVVEAKLEWPAQSRNQWLAEVCTLHKTRQDAGKNSTVYGVLSNGQLWQFAMVNQKGDIFTSHEIYATLDLCATGGIREAYRWLLYVTRKAQEAWPTATPVASTESL